MEDLFNRLQQKLTTEEQEVETGHEVTHTEDADASGSSDEDDGEDKPEKVAEHDDLQHVEVGPGQHSKCNKNPTMLTFPPSFTDQCAQLINIPHKHPSASPNISRF